MKKYGILFCMFHIITCSFSQVSSSNRRPHNQEWELLFDGKNPANHWTSLKGKGFPENGWKAMNGELQLLPGQNGGDIMSKRTYEDFILEIEFKLDKNANTGIKYFVSPLQTKQGTVEWNGPEFQMIDDNNHESVKGGISPKTETGSVYLLYAPNESKVFKPFGQWNKAKIVAKGNIVEHWLNDVMIVRYERGSTAFRALVAKTKFDMYTSQYGEAVTGHILLTDHQDGAAFRNIRIKRL